jgi:hypothetical protein
MTHSSPAETSAAESLWVPGPTTPIEEVSFDGALVLANRHASHGDEIDSLLEKARRVVPVLRGAKIIETVPDDDETVGRVRAEIGEDTDKSILLWVMGGDNAYRCGARSATSTAMVLASVGLGNGNVAQKITNSEKWCKNPENLLTPGTGVVREQYLFEVIFNEKTHYAATNAGFGETGVGAHKISSQKHREHPLYGLRLLRELKEYHIAFESIAEIKHAKRCVPILEGDALELEDGTLKLILGRDFMFGPEMAKVADMPYAQLDGPEAIYFDMKNHGELASWIYGVQTGSVPYERIAAGKTHTVEVLADTWAYIDGDPYRMQPGMFSVRCLPETYKALTVPVQRTQLKQNPGVRGFLEGFRPIVTSMIAR